MKIFFLNIFPAKEQEFRFQPHVKEGFLNLINLISATCRNSCFSSAQISAENLQLVEVKIGEL